ncbi:GNAT family N-acetyltransferase [Leifsonia sp. fls2-241-R2A-40a]|uniref:GNAT family N-acetyltransferase n=1 Tax=Leifsonia sp. fls2-241-R2A-40a TaxID=3040290 RepID=UPI00254F94BC|nr:GNAT family N-acetyltransferase [Leifsonia sp. fls2-241-R2A-40a]
MTGWVVRASTEDDWQQYRALRFEMLEDTPMAFLETLDQARAHPDEHWKRRAANASPTSRLFAAVAEDGRWLGSMGGYQPQSTHDPYLVGVYVSPRWRGRRRGMTDALLDAVIEWARGRGRRLLLDVHEDNEAAIRSYLRRGFVFTGHTQPYPLDRTAEEREMMLPLEPPVRG